MLTGPKGETDSGQARGFYRRQELARSIFNWVSAMNANPDKPALALQPGNAFVVFGLDLVEFFEVRLHDIQPLFDGREPANRCPWLTP